MCITFCVLQVREMRALRQHLPREELRVAVQLPVLRALRVRQPMPEMQEELPGRRHNHAMRNVRPVCETSLLRAARHYRLTRRSIVCTFQWDSVPLLMLLISYQFL